MKNPTTAMLKQALKDQGATASALEAENTRLRNKLRELEAASFEPVTPNRTASFLAQINERNQRISSHTSGIHCLRQQIAESKKALVGDIAKAGERFLKQDVNLVGWRRILMRLSGRPATELLGDVEIIVAKHVKNLERAL